AIDTPSSARAYRTSGRSTNSIVVTTPGPHGRAPRPRLRWPRQAELFQPCGPRQRPAGLGIEDAGRGLAPALPDDSTGRNASAGPRGGDAGPLTASPPRGGRRDPLGR